MRHRLATLAVAVTAVLSLGAAGPAQAAAPRPHPGSRAGMTTRASSPAAVALALSPAGQAGTTGTWTVTPGGSFSAGGARRADIGGLVCQAPGLRTIKGRLKSGSGLPARLGTIWLAEKRSLGCDVQNGAPLLTLTFTGLPWRIWASSYSARLNTVYGRIRGISATIAATPGSPACSAVLGGPAGAATGWNEFRSANSRSFAFLPTGDLRFWNVSGCGGVISDGERAPIFAWFGRLTATATSTAEIITSP